MKDFTIGVIIGIIIGAGLMFLLMKKEITEVKVPVALKIKTPIIKKEFDTIYLPGEIIRLPGERIIDSTYYDQWKKLTDSLEREKMFKDAITIREYNTTFDDDTLKIDVYSKTRGTLLEQAVNYTVKPFEVTLDTTLNVPVPKKPMFFIGATMTTVPTLEVDQNQVLGFGPQAIFIDKKHKFAYYANYDLVNKGWSVGAAIKLK